ncbi:hypothetical protein [Pseudoduganella sp. R-34]|uniref:hypothetical protein n=1 Tax=Pseudoduganella sp. R-34 TaxID=3404062 RepID=UPI003CF7541E
MQNFSIELTDNVTIIAGEPSVSGRIRIGVFEESFSCPVTYWNRADYLSQWKTGLGRLLNGEHKSALVTSMRDPMFSNFVFWWVMYLNGDDIVVQNHVLFLDELGEPFELSALYQFIPNQEGVEPGEPPPSEWKTNLAEIKSFLQSIESPQ